MPPTRQQAIDELKKRANTGDDNARQILLDKNIIEPLEPTGGIAGFARDITKPAATLLSRPIQAGLAIAGKTPAEQELELPFFGKIPTVGTGKDVVRDIGRVAETASLGIGGGVGFGVARQGLRGALGQAVKRGVTGGAKAGALGGAGQQVAKTGEINTGTAGAGALGAGLGAVTGGALGGAIGGGTLASKAATRIAARRIPKSTGGRLGALRARVSSQDAERLTAPVLNKKERIAGIKSGRGKEGGLPLFRKVSIEGSKRDKEVAQSVSGILENTKNQTKNIALIDDEVSVINQSIKDGLGQNDRIFNQSQLATRLSKAKEKSRIIFGSDKALEARYDTVAGELLQSVKKNNLSSLFAARQRFDAIVRQKFPRTFDGGVDDNVTRNAILDTRREVNEFIADSLPKGNKFKADLRKEHLMLEAIENLAEQAEQKVPKSRRGLLNTVLLMAGGGFIGAIGGQALGLFSEGGGQ